MKTVHLSGLLLQWEDNFERGRDLSAGDLCPDQPEVADDLRQAIEALKRMRRLLADQASSVTPSPPKDSWATIAPEPEARRPAVVGASPPGYEVLEELGRGGMGVVYKARQVRLNRLVALKMILRGGHACHEDRLRFLAEAEMAASLRHPGIVAIYDFGTHGELPYLALEFCAGGSLADVLDGGPLAAEEAARVVGQLAVAMQAAHNRGIVHRDLKPGNVLLASGGLALSVSQTTGGSRPPLASFILKVTDFGLARRVEADSGMTQTGAIVGTPSYMAPEQAEGKKSVGPAADTYALGAILYECLTGRPPFHAANPIDTLFLVRSEDPVAPRQLNRQIPADLETICLRCLHKDPARRYASASHLAEDLRRWQAGEPIAARPVGHLERFLKWARRRPAVAALSAAVILAVGLAVAGLIFAIRQTAQALAAEQSKLGLAEDELKARKDAEENLGLANKARADAEENLALARKAEYRADVVALATKLELCTRAWQADDLGIAEHHLDHVAAHLRDLWEYRYVRDLCNRKVRVLRGHGTLVLTVAFRPDGLRVLSADQRLINGWDALTGKLLHSSAKHVGPIRGVVYLPDGERFCSVSEQGTYKAWAASTGEELFGWQGPRHSAYCLAASPDSRHVVSACGDHAARVWDARTGKQVRELLGHKNKVTATDWSGDGKWIASGSDDKTVKIWDAATGSVVHTLTGPEFAVTWVTFTPDSQRVAACSGSRVWMWEVGTGQPIPVPRSEYEAARVGFSKDGRVMVTADHTTVRVWDARTHKQTRVLRGHKGMVICCAVSADGQRIVSGDEQHVVRVWDLSATQASSTWRGHSGGVRCVTESPDRTRLVTTGTDRAVKVLDRLTGKEVWAYRGHAAPVAWASFSPDGQRVVSGSFDKAIKVFDAQTGRELRTITGHEAYIHGVVYSSDGKTIFSASRDKTVRQWDAETGKELRRFAGMKDTVISLTLSPDGTRLAAGGGNHVARVWDVASGRVLHELRGHQGPVVSVAFNHTGTRLVTGAQDNLVMLWDAATGQRLHTLGGHTTWVNSAAFSPDGTRIVSSTNVGAVRLWDTATGQHLISLTDHENKVLGPSSAENGINHVVFSADGQRIYAGGVDGMVRVWGAPEEPRHR